MNHKICQECGSFKYETKPCYVCSRNQEDLAILVAKYTHTVCTQCSDKSVVRPKRLCEDCRILNRHKQQAKNQANYRTMNRFSAAKAHAKARKKEWNLTEEEYYSLVAMQCNYCNESVGDTGIRLDRLDNDKGYLSDNVVSCCKDCNQIRFNVLTPEEMKIGMKAIIEYRKLKAK